jgi:hypothetical protein
MLVWLTVLCFIILVTGSEHDNQSLGSGIAAPGEPFWMETIKHQGIAAYNANPQEYEVFRNVKVFEAQTSIALCS